MKKLFTGKLAFLTSNRFWAMALGIVVTYLTGEITAVEALQAFFAGFVGIRTVDRFSEKIGTKPAVTPDTNLNT